MDNLLALPAATLLEKFGAGKHAPGSGSAAALLGLLSAEMILTVGRLTVLKKEYQASHTVIKEACSRVEAVAIPTLTALFQQDAEVFDKVIITRRARDSATEQAEKKRLSNAAIEQLKLATAIPFRIADTCLELIDHAITVFDGGFKGARGDTGVAISSAVAGVLSAVFVINLNLKSFRRSYWARQQRKTCDELQRTVENKYQSVMGRVMQLREEEISHLPNTDVDDFIESLSQSAKKSYSRSEIQDRADAVHAIVWRRRPDEWHRPNTRQDNVALLSPDFALELLGYSHEIADTLGTFRADSQTFEVAGLLENDCGRVKISAQMPPPVRRFTAAHELGHVVLHPHLKEAHRDRPIDGSTPVKSRIEQEADSFASYFLMPKNLLIERFRSVFGQPPFILNDDTAFALLHQGLQEAQARIRQRRDLSRWIAQTAHYNGLHIIPLAEQFGVSIEAMAIRLEELNLIGPNTTFQRNGRKRPSAEL